MSSGMKTFCILTLIILGALFTTSMAWASYSGVNLSQLSTTTVSVSGEKTVGDWTFAGEYAVDGDITTWWNPGKKGNGSDFSWLVLDLGECHELDAIQVFADSRRRRDTFSLLLSTSVDGKSWTPVEWLKGSFSWWTSSFLALVDDETPAVQYVKVALADGARHSRIREIQVWGDAAPSSSSNGSHAPLPGSIWFFGSAVAGLAGVRRIVL
ncbi:MAG: discoidin domain-containing protein [Deltaproteobacteria bacterium]|nr:discoidin domain-containing protein [Deltaproteobacteria bacterium]